MQTNETTEALVDAAVGPVVSLAEQPGGRVLTRDGKPTGVASIGEGATAAFQFLRESQPWLGPVCEAAVSSSDAEGAGRATVITVWGDENAKEYVDAEKHAAYVAYLRSEIGRYHAWFWPLLDSARAGVVVLPPGVVGVHGRFAVSVSSRPGAQFDIPGVAPLLALIPFAVDGETPQ